MNCSKTREKERAMQGGEWVGQEKNLKESLGSIGPFFAAASGVLVEGRIVFLR